MQQAGTPARYGKDAAPAVSRREQRKRDQALGRVPFAVKLDGELAARLRTLAAEADTPLDTLVEELLRKGLAA